MPIYEYRCNECNKEFEYLVMGSDEDVDCPSCKSKKVARMMSTCGFVSKGGGGEVVSSSAGSSGCNGCAATNCGSCSI